VTCLGCNAKQPQNAGELVRGQADGTSVPLWSVHVERKKTATMAFPIIGAAQI